MPTTDRHKDRWIVRASLAGLVVVLCFLVGFSVVTRHSVAVKSASADRATRLSATYQDARHWVGEQKSVERQYRIEGSYAVVFAHRQAERRLIADLDHVLELDSSPATRATVARLLRLQADYHSASQALFDAVDENDQERVLCLRPLAPSTPSSAILADLVYRQAAAASSSRARAQRRAAPATRCAPTGRSRSASRIALLLRRLLRSGRRALRPPHRRRPSPPRSSGWPRWPSPIRSRACATIAPSRRTSRVSCRSWPAPACRWPSSSSTSTTSRPSTTPTATRPATSACRPWPTRSGPRAAARTSPTAWAATSSRSSCPTPARGARSSSPSACARPPRPATTAPSPSPRRPASPRRSRCAPRTS